MKLRSSRGTRRVSHSREARGIRLRTKVVALLLSLTALWAFAAFVTLREGLNLLFVSTLTQNVGRPTEALVAALQQERRQSVVLLASTTAGQRAEQRAALLQLRAQTDRQRVEFDRLALAPTTGWAADATLQSRIRSLSGLLDGLARQREAVDVSSASRLSAAAGYTSLIDAGFRVYSSISVLDDEQIAKESRALVALSRAREVLSQQDALLAGIIASGRFAGAEHAEFVKLVGVQRFQYAEAVAELPEADRERFDALVGGPALTVLRATEDHVVTGAADALAPVSGESWNATISAALAELRAFELAAAEGTLQRATPAAIGVIVRLALAGGLGLIAVIASIIVSITTARRIVRQLVRLRDAAHELATRRLPGVVEQLRAGETVDVDTQAPPLDFGSDEIGQVGQAFNAVQRTAVRVAVEQAELRRSVRDVFLSLARRTQALVHRQLSLLDAMERKETNAEELATLFRVDHLATRMRRNAENLIVLSGANSGRGWRNPVPMVDVIRGAAAEVEDYTRVNVLPIAPAGLSGRAVGDVIHLLAELIENAAAFSPPHTVVQVGGQVVANGFAVEIEDRGLGMSEEVLDAANEQLRHPPEFHLSSTARLGLYVVGRLSERHGIRVQLRESPYGGTTAIVLIPSALVVARPDEGSFGDVAARLRLDRPGTSTAGQDQDPVLVGTAGSGGFDAPADVVVAPGGNGHYRGVTALAADVLDHNAVGGTILERLMPLPEPVAPPAIESIDSAAGVDTLDLSPDDVDGDAIPTQPPNPSDGTVFGLPRRQRQANLPAKLRDNQAARSRPRGDGPWAGASAPAGRAPEEVRALMSAYQSGTLRGRQDVAESALSNAVLPAADDPEPVAPQASTDTTIVERGQL